jgi:hypothetical protein
MHRQRRVLLALAVVVVVGAGCGSGASPGASTFEQTTTGAAGPSEASTAASEPAAPTKVAYADVCDPANDNKLIRTQGFLGLGVVAQRDGDPVTGDPYWHIELARKSGGSGEVSVFLYEGDGNNQMQPVPDQYSPDDLKVKATNGDPVGPDDKVRIVGEANVGDGVCYIDPVERIRKL